MAGPWDLGSIRTLSAERERERERERELVHIIKQMICYSFRYEIDTERACKIRRTELQVKIEDRER